MYLFNFRKTQKPELNDYDIAKQTGTVKPSGESTTAYAEKTLEQISKLQEVVLNRHSSGRKLQVCTTRILYQACPRTTRITLDGLLRGKITIMLTIKNFSNPFFKD